MTGWCTIPRKNRNTPSPAFIIGKTGQKHSYVIPLWHQMFDAKGMSSVIEPRIKVGQKTFDDPDKVAIGTLLRNSYCTGRRQNSIAPGENRHDGLSKGCLERA